MNATGKIGGRSIVNKSEATFKKGSLMFIEGETSTEMYILRSGKIRILKQEGENSVELAVLGAGSVLGELSLLDRQPRGATAQVLEETTATVIDTELFEKTLAETPSWLATMLRLVVKRLRDTMKRTSDDVVKKNVAGVIQVLSLLHDSEGVLIKEQKVKQVAVARVKEAVYSIIGLGAIETENVFLHLILKDQILIKKNERGLEQVLVKDHEVLVLYLNYLRAKQRGAAMFGEKLSDNATNLLNDIFSAGDKNGTRLANGLIRIGCMQVEIELERAKGAGSRIDLDALDELIQGKIIVEEAEVTQSRNGTHKRSTLVYNPDALQRLKTFRKWLPLFSEEIQF